MVLEHIKIYALSTHINDAGSMTGFFEVCRLDKQGQDKVRVYCIQFDEWMMRRQDKEDG